jgi:hypothetical protein
MKNFNADVDWDRLFSTVSDVAMESTFKWENALQFAAHTNSINTAPAEEPPSYLTDHPDFGLLDNWPIMPYPTPGAKDNVTTTSPPQLVQLTHDIYNTATTADSDAARQQWLRAELHHSLRAS